MPGRQDGQASQVSRSPSCLHELRACTQVLAGEHDQRWHFLLCASLECLEGGDKEKETGWEGSCYSMKGWMTYEIIRVTVIDFLIGLWIFLTEQLQCGFWPQHRVEATLAKAKPHEQ